MKERPILFSGPMVRAILAGTKTQTRRALSAKAIAYIDEHQGFREPDNAKVCPYGQPGDRLWVRETCRAHEITAAEDKADTWALGDRYGEGPNEGLDGVVFAADNAFVAIANTREASDEWVKLNYYGGKRRGATVPGIHMPRWASRITLEITGVRVERLQDISEADAMAEGIERSGECNWRDYGDAHNDFTSARRSYRSLWESINGPGAWDENPWVWAITFERIKS